MASKLIRAKNVSGYIVHIDSVENGLKCNCRCPVCNTTLIARQGKKRDYHFAHSNGKECITAPETALHLLAKEIIRENKKLKLDENKEFEYKTTELEKIIKNFTVDAYVKNENSDLIIEIFVTHSLENKKVEQLTKDKTPILEINLSGHPYDIPRNELEEEVLNNPMNRTLINWIDEDVNLDKPKQGVILEDDLSIEKINNKEEKKTSILEGGLFVAGLLGLFYWVYKKTKKKY